MFSLFPSPSPKWSIALIVFLFVTHYNDTESTQTGLNHYAKHKVQVVTQGPKGPTIHFPLFYVGYYFIADTFGMLLRQNLLSILEKNLQCIDSSCN